MNKNLSYLVVCLIAFSSFDVFSQSMSLSNCKSAFNSNESLCEISTECSNVLVRKLDDKLFENNNPYLYGSILPRFNNEQGELSSSGLWVLNTYKSICEVFGSCEKNTNGDCDIDCKYEAISYHFKKAMALGFQEKNIYKAVEELEEANEIIGKIPINAHRPFDKEVVITLAAFQLRLGELRNCMNNHNVDSCIFPLEGNAIHQEKKGVKAAIKTLNHYVDSYGYEQRVDWVLNVAYQALGKDPQEVLGDRALPLDQLTDKSGLSRFYDVAGLLGLQKMSQEAGGAATADFNGDGYLDMAFGSLGPCDPVLMFYSDGEGGFIDASQASGLGDFSENMVIVPADYDNDGDVDIYLGSGGWANDRKNYLLENDGTGIFTDVTEKRNLVSLKNHNIGISWADYDLDGWLDILVCNEFKRPQLFKNIKGEFKEVRIGLDGNKEGRCKSVAWGDYDNDSFPDVFLSYHASENYLYKNVNGKSFVEVKLKAIDDTPRFGFVSWFFDYDNDGWLDLFVANFEPYNSVQFYEEMKGLPFKGSTLQILKNINGEDFIDVTAELGLNLPMTTMGVNYGDVNNDGFPDIYFGTGAPKFHMLEPNRLFINQGGKKFVEATFSAKVGNLQKGHGISFADMNYDGHQDIVAQFGGAFPSDKFYPSLYLNPAESGNNWINIKLNGIFSNKQGFGAKITLVVKSDDGIIHNIHKLVDLGGTFGSNPTDAHVGIGKASDIVEVVVQWPSKTGAVRYKAVEINRFVTLGEDKSITYNTYNTFDWSEKIEANSSGHKHH